MSEFKYEPELKSIVLQNVWFMTILRTVRECQLPDWFVGGGVVRSLVWDYLHNYSDRTGIKDVDVVYFQANYSKTRDRSIVELLTAKLPTVPWEVTNQAAVHLWYEKYFGYSVLPLRSCEEAISTFPETATSVGIKLLPNDELYICAPCGLEDLMNMILRRNSKRVTQEIFVKRLKEKGVTQKWPKVKVIND